MFSLAFKFCNYYNYTNMFINTISKINLDICFGNIPLNISKNLQNYYNIVFQEFIKFIKIIEELLMCYQCCYK